nr:acyl-CoA thioesterase [Kribbia dieselivorans]
MTSTAVSGRTTLRFMAAPTDAGQGGTVSGGRILEWIDKAGFACAAGWSGRYCVTAYVGNIDFRRPVRIGDLVEVSAQIVLTGRTSMTIVVDVASGTPYSGTTEHAFECRIVFVAVDDEGRPTAVPQWAPETAVFLAAKAEAERRIELRARVKELVAAQDWSGDSAGARGHAAVLGRADGRQLGREGARRDLDALDRRDRVRLRQRMVEVVRGQPVLGWGEFPAADPDR